MTRRESAARLTIGAAVCLLLASTAGAQQYDGQQGAGGYETLGGAQQAAPAAPQVPGGMPDVSGIQQKMQEQMMQQMAQQMQAASPASQMQNAAQQVGPAAQQVPGGMPDVSGIQQQMQQQMMQQMMQQMQAASPAAQMQNAAQQAAPAVPQMQGGMPDVSGIQQKMQEQMMQQMVPQMQAASPAAQMQNAAQQAAAAAPATAPQMAPAAGGFPVDAAISSLKIDPAVQSSINDKMMKIIEQTMKETLANPNPPQINIPSDSAAVPQQR